MGRQSKISASHDGVFLFADSTASDFNSSAPNEFAVRATGGIRLVTAVDASGKPIAGVRLAPGSDKWESIGNTQTSKLPDQSKQIATLQSENALLQSKIEGLDQRIAALEQEKNTNDLLPSGTFIFGMVLAGFIFSKQLSIR